MTNRDVMKKHLLEKVCKPLLAEGFTGKFPHYRRACDKTIELVTFQTNKDGGSFTVEVSAVFPHRKNTNCAEEIIDPATVTVWNTNERYRLSGMFDGWFYYCDLNESSVLARSIGKQTKQKTRRPKATDSRRPFTKKPQRQSAMKSTNSLPKRFDGFQNLKRRIQRLESHLFLCYTTPIKYKKRSLI